jgi:hypothetical protein
VTPGAKREALRRLFRLYAIPGPRFSNPARCFAKPGDSPFWANNDDKVLYATEKDASDFASEAKAQGLAEPQEPYLCPRGAHWHLRTIAKAQEREAWVERWKEL